MSRSRSSNEPIRISLFNLLSAYSSYNNTNRHGNSCKIFDPSTALPEILIGGEYPIGELHWVQKDDKDIVSDKSVSESESELVLVLEKDVLEKLWKGWPLITGRELEIKIRRMEKEVSRYIAAGLEDPRNLRKHYILGVEAHEGLTRGYLIHCAEVIEIALSTIGKSKERSLVLERLKRKYANGHGKVNSLKGSLELAESCKNRGNAAGKAGKHEIAIRAYLDGLVALWPWTASTIMSFEQASQSGLVKTEQALLLNIANIALAAIPRAGPKREPWESIVQVSCEVVLQMRYATYGSLTKAFGRLAQLEAQREDGQQEEEGVYKLMAEFFEGKPVDQWAHKFCVNNHICHD